MIILSLEVFQKISGYIVYYKLIQNWEERVSDSSSIEEDKEVHKSRGNI
jgi:hypothetical protein